MRLVQILEHKQENFTTIVPEAVVAFVDVKLTGQFQKELKRLSLKPGAAEELVRVIVVRVVIAI
jgi:uncharacterized protein YfeS